MLDKVIECKLFLVYIKQLRTISKEVNPGGPDIFSLSSKDNKGGQMKEGVENIKLRMAERAVG
jgi:hypothetical protein